MGVRYEQFVDEILVLDLGGGSSATASTAPKSTSTSAPTASATEPNRRSPNAKSSVGLILPLLVAMGRMRTESEDRLEDDLALALSALGIVHPSEKSEDRALLEEGNACEESVAVGSVALRFPGRGRLVQSPDVPSPVHSVVQ